MTNSQPKQLNTFELKREISRVVKALESTTILIETQEFQTLDNQENKTELIKLLFKEFNNSNEETFPVIKILLLRYCDEEILLKELENIIFDTTKDNNIKLHAIELISTFKDDWHSQNYDSYLVYDAELIQKETKELLTNAVTNPELQIDFLDFFNAIPPKDQKMLIDSLKEDQGPEDLANILTPLFLSYPNTEIGLIALKMLATTKSKYAYKALTQTFDKLKETIKPDVKKCINELRLSGAAFCGITKQNPKSSKYFLIPPDGEGNSSLLYEESNEQNDKIRLIGIVLDDYSGVRECLGFNEISEFEATFLTEKLTGSDFKVEITPENFKMLLNEAEFLNYKKSAPPYEYNCWKKVFIDIEPANINIKEFLAEQFEPKEITPNETIELLNSDFTIPWFYTNNFGDETEAFFKELDTKLKTSAIEEINIDNLIQENIDTIFFPEEKENWVKRIYLTAYCKFIANEKEVANSLYKLTLTQQAMNMVYDFIIKQSVFQYFLRMLSEENFMKYKKANIESILTYLEKLWGFYV